MKKSAATQAATQPVNQTPAPVRILAPMIGTRRKPDAEAEKDIRTQNQNQAILVSFRSVYVFDVAQTEGKELPELAARGQGDGALHR